MAGKQQDCRVRWGYYLGHPLQPAVQKRERKSRSHESILKPNLKGKLGSTQITLKGWRAAVDAEVIGAPNELHPKT